MSLAVAIQMDPIEPVNIDGASSASAKLESPSMLTGSIGSIWIATARLM